MLMKGDGPVKKPLWIVVGFAALVVALGPASNAQEKKTTTAGKARHCVSNSAEPTRIMCYDNFTAAIAAATGGRISDAPADVRMAMSDKGLMERLNHTKERKGGPQITYSAGSVVIGILYSAADFSGSTFTLTSSFGCTDTLNDIDHQWAYLGDDWNDVPQSIRTFNNCYARLWEHRNFTGAMLDFAGDRSDFGSMHDKISSIQFS
jgi:hypothetical protein